MARARKGTLEHRKSGWHCRLTVNVEGESVRKWFPLDTDDKQIARLRMKRMIKEHANVANVDLDKASSDATRVETYKEAAERIRAAREVEGVEDMLNERNRDELYFNPAIGHLLVTEVRAKHIRTLLEEAARRGRLDLDESAPGYKPRPSSRGTLELVHTLETCVANVGRWKRGHRLLPRVERASCRGVSPIQSRCNGELAHCQPGQLDRSLHHRLNLRRAA